MVMSLQEVQDTMGCGRTKVFELIAYGILEQAPRYGRNVRIYRDSVEKALERRTRRRRRTKIQAETVRLEDIRLYNDSDKG